MPWGDNNNDNGQGPWGGNTPPHSEQPDFDELLKKSRERFSGVFSKGGGGIGGDGGNTVNKGAILLAILVAAILWLASGAYVIAPNEQGVILRFGAFHRIADPGLNYHAPSPIEKLYKVPVTNINRVEVGVHTGTGRSQGVKILAESLMLTGDENIVDIDFEVQWKIKNASNFLFKVKDPAGTVKSVAESAMRDVVGRTQIAKALTEGRSEIEQEAQNSIQKMLDNYETGIEIVMLQMREVQPPAAVIDAFRDVQTARADKERKRNEAETYRNDIIPRARGESEKIIQAAEAYKREVVARSEGDASRFIAVYNEYKVAKNVTKKRIYLETMEKIMGGTEKIILDKGASGSGVVPYLPLPELNKRRN